MPSLHFDGYYFTGPVAWEDWHAGVRMHGVYFHYTRYYPNGEYLSCYRDFDFVVFWEFSESVTPELFANAKRDHVPRIGDADPLCSAGDYSVADGILTETFAPDWTGGQSWQSQFRILDDRLEKINGDGPSFSILFKPKPAN